MTVEISGNDAPAAAQVFSLESELTIAEVAGVQQQMLALVQESEEILLDGSAVARVDAAGIQLLAALAKEAEMRHLTLEWRGVSNDLQEAARVLGLEEAVKLSSVSP